jgi:hypothetical protein
VPDRTHHTALARKLRAQLNGRAFLTIRRREITELLREISGEPTTRIKSRVADDLQLALLDQGVRCYPHLAATEMIDNVRLFHAGSLLGQLVDLIAYPATETDKDLADVLTKIKGKWTWAPEAGPAPVGGEAPASYPQS